MRRASTGSGEGGARGRKPGRKVARGCGGRAGPGGRQAWSGRPASSASASARLLLPASRATEITTTSNFLQEPHTGGEKISQAFPMKSFPQALPTPRASWLGAGPSSRHLLLGALGEGAAAGCAKPAQTEGTFMPQAPHLPQECFASLHKAPFFSSGLNLKLLSVRCVPVWGGGAGGEVAREQERGARRGEQGGGADARPSGSLFTFNTPQPNSA